MSMNLACLIKTSKDNDSRGYITEFPFQTSTEITKKVLREEDNKERLNIIKEYLESSITDIELRKMWLEEVKDILENDNLKLIAV